MRLRTLESKEKRRVGIGATALLVLGVGGLVVWRLTVRPPASALAGQERALQALRAADGQRYAPDLTKRAELEGQSAMMQLRHENERFFALRDYAAIDRRVRKATALAIEATKRANAVRDSLFLATDLEFALLRDKVEEFKVQLGRLPNMRTFRRQVSEAETHLVAADSRRRYGDLIGCAAALQDAATALSGAGLGLNRLLAEYFASVPEWKSWANETIDWSAKHQAVALIVDKMAHQCLVYSSGRLVATLDVELGPEWIGPKQFEGDLSTPEGRYLVRRKRGPGETVYHLALEINYPNDEDRRRFEKARMDGQLPAGTRLGGNIEIHGEGGRAANWTRGCIALENQDMKSIFDLAEVGTPVTIVGALEYPFQPDALDLSLSAQ